MSAEFLKKDTLKEYYVNLQNMYNNAMSMLTAINQSLQTNSTEVLVNVMDTDDTYTTVRIPSFLYLENKLEQLESNFNNLFNIPESGEAWFNNDDGMQKLELVKATTSPLKPIINNNNNLYAQFAANNFLKDLVSPRTFIRLNIDNLPNNINNIFVRKVTITDSGLFDTILDQDKYSKVTYTELTKLLYNKNLNDDYYEYDSEFKTPIKRDRFRSEFKITEIPTLPQGNPWVEYDEAHGHTRYKIRLNTIQYVDKDDDSIKFKLQLGDLLCLENENVIYKVINISSSTTTDGNDECLLILEEQIGHQVLQTTEENSSMILRLYNEDFSEYHYIDVPLEEDPYIILYIGTINNNIRSLLSDPVFLNLNNIEVHNADGNVILENGKPMNYITFYNRYCTNIGDLIAGLSEVAYPQLSNYSPTEMFEMTEGTALQKLVNESLPLTNLDVLKINEHLIESDIFEDINKWHAEKSRINTDLTNVQKNIDQIYNQLITTDFSKNLITTQFELQEKLTNYYNERTLLTSQKINVVENINIYKNDVRNYVKSKYRITGLADPTELIAYLKNRFGMRTDIVGIDIRYKYVSVEHNTTSEKDVNDNIISTWNKQPSIDRNRKLVYNVSHSSYSINYETYNQANSPIQWNKINIPIRDGENVDIRIRYKLNIGQPFIDLYTPWSGSIPVEFPTRHTELVEMSDIMNNNENDMIDALFNKTLINNGYNEHISDKMVDNSKVFYHNAEKINSGFLDSTNKLMSLKEKLDVIDEEVYKYSSLIDNDLNAKVRVYLTCEGQSYDLHENSINEITPFTDNTTGHFTRKNLNINIQNIADTELIIYSMFPGKIDVNIRDFGRDMIYASESSEHFKNVLLVNSSVKKPKDAIKEQTLGQWIYFRNDDSDTYEKLYTPHDAQQQGVYNKQIMFNEDELFIVSGYNTNNDKQHNLTLLPNDKAETNDKYDDYRILFEHYIDNSSHTYNQGDNAENIQYITDTTDIYDVNLNNRAVFVPCLDVSTALLCEHNKDNIGLSKTLAPREILTIPCIFEYYLSEGSAVMTNENEESCIIEFTFKKTRLGPPSSYAIKLTAINNTLENQ